MSTIHMPEAGAGRAEPSYRGVRAAAYDPTTCKHTVSRFASGSATVSPHQIKFCRSLLAKASIIENTKIRVCLHVYSDSDDRNITNLKYRGCSRLQSYV
jgi:hypothetical protein